MSKELSDLYNSVNINIDEISETAKANVSDLRFVITKKQQGDNFAYAIDVINISTISALDVEYALLNDTMFDDKENAMKHLNYLTAIDRVATAAMKANIADNNYKADFNNEDERKYYINYNHRNKSISYDFIYTILAAFTDYRLVFRTQTITENFINSFRTELLLINEYRVEKLLK